MLAFVATFGFSFAFYLLFTAGSGSIAGFWSSEELLAGILLAGLVALMTRRFLFTPGARTSHAAALNPFRWALAIFYTVGPFFLEMAKANVDVAARVITGRIRPGIVRVKSGMNSDLATLMLANSITLTPGTLTVDVEEESNDLFVHMIHVPDGMETRDSIEAREVFSLFNCPAWIRRIAE